MPAADWATKLNVFVAPGASSAPSMARKPFRSVELVGDAIVSVYDCDGVSVSPAAIRTTRAIGSYVTKGGTARLPPDCERMKVCRVIDAAKSRRSN